MGFRVTIFIIQVTISVLQVTIFLWPKSKSNWFFRVTISHSGYHFENCCKWPKNSYHWTKILLRSSWSTCFFCQNQYQLNWMWKNSNVSKNCNPILENGNVNKNGNMVTCYHFDTYFLAPYILTLMLCSGIGWFVIPITTRSPQASWRGNNLISKKELPFKQPYLQKYLSDKKTENRFGFSTKKYIM